VTLPISRLDGCLVDDCLMALSTVPFELAKVDSPAMNKPSPIATSKIGATMNGVPP
jgi:hypothetical protein